MTTGIEVVLLPSVQVRLPPLPVRVGASLTETRVTVLVMPGTAVSRPALAVPPLSDTELRVTTRVEPVGASLKLR